MEREMETSDENNQNANEAAVETGVPVETVETGVPVKTGVPSPQSPKEDSQGAMEMEEGGEREPRAQEEQIESDVGLSRKRKHSDVGYDDDAYRALLNNYCTLQQKYAKLTLQHSSETVRSQSWYQAYIQATADMGQRLTELTNENAKINTLTETLNTLIREMQATMANWKPVEEQLKSMLINQKAAVDCTASNVHEIANAETPKRQTLDKERVPEQLASDETGKLESGNVATGPILKLATVDEVENGGDDDVKIVEEIVQNDLQVTDRRGRGGLCQMDFDFKGDPAYHKPDFTKFLGKCKIAQGVSKMFHEQRKLYGFWYWKGYKFEELFGKNGLSDQGKLPTLDSDSVGDDSKSGSCAAASGGDSKSVSSATASGGDSTPSTGSKQRRVIYNFVVPGEFTDEADRQYLHYKDLIPAGIEKATFDHVYTKKCVPDEEGKCATDRKRILFGCTVLSEKMLDSGLLVHYNCKENAIVSVGRAHYLAFSLSGCRYDVVMDELKRVPCVYAILKCIFTRFPYLDSEKMDAELDGMPLYVLNNLRQLVYTARSRAKPGGSNKV